MTGKSPLMVVGDFEEDYETVVPFQALRTDVEQFGGTWSDGVTVDGNLLTARAWPDHPEWLAAFLDVPGTEVRHGTAATADD